MSYRRSKKDKQKLKHLYDVGKHSYRCGVYYDPDDDRIKKDYIPKLGMKQTTSRKYRRKKSLDIPKKSNHYRKENEYWWVIF